MNDLNSLIAVLELTGGARIVLRSDERPHVLVGDTRHELATAQVTTTSSLENLADQILSPAGKHALAEQRAAVEPLVGHDSVIPVRVAVRRIGPQMSVELQRNVHSPETNHVAPIASPVTPPAVVAGHLPSPDPLPNVSAVAEPGRVRARKTPAPVSIIDGRQRASDVGTLEHLVRRAAQRKATTLYLRGGQAPLARVGDALEPLSAEPVEASVMKAFASGAPGAVDDARRSASFTVSVQDSADSRQFRAHAFSDELGPGLVVHLTSRSRESVLQNGIPRQVKGICQDDDGLVVVSATTSGDLLEMIAEVGSWTAGRRAGYVVSIEPLGGLGRDIVGAFVSPRRVGDGDMAAAIQGVAHERPDVLVVPLPSGTATEEAVRVARTGSLVIVGIVAPTATRAIESLLSHIKPEHRLQLRRSLAASFRAAFSYRALHTAGGGRKVLHDLLLATPDVSGRIEQGDVDGIEKLQRTGAGGMRWLDAVLVDAVARGEISLRQAASHAVDRRQVVKMIRQSARERRGGRR
jgi:Tfp pilus assembly pilus retraction ATPase PilT